MFWGVSLPFIGTVLGAACVFFVGRKTGKSLRRAIEGFSAGVMLAAAIWSLLIPSMELAEERGTLSAIPAAGGFLCGIVFFLLCDRSIARYTERLPDNGSMPRGSIISVFAVAVHNLPEGMAVGAIYADILCTNGTGLSAALALSIGIAVQNLPEGAIVAMPMNASGMGKLKSFAIGALSGVVEPIGAVLTLLAAGIAIPILPYLLSFAAGAMMYAVLEEFTGNSEKGGSLWILAFSAGFVLMMSLDVLLG